MNNQDDYERQAEEEEELSTLPITMMTTNRELIDNDDDGDMRFVQRKRGSKWSAKKELIVYSVFVIVICLTIFNLYIFYWTISSLNGTGRSFLHSNQWAKMEFFKNSNDLQASLKYNGILKSKETFQVDKLKSIASNTLNIIGKKAIEFTLRKNKLETIDLLRLDSFGRKIVFPNGFRLKGLKKESTLDNEAVLVCSNNNLADDDGFCLVQNISNIVLNSMKGVDFLNKSLEANRIELKRLHSATNSLQLLSRNTSSFRTLHQGSINIKSLDGITLSSRNSFVSSFLLSKNRL